MTMPPRLTPEALLAVQDQVERARLLAREAHRDQRDKAGVDYYSGHLTDVWQRAVAYGADVDEQAAALLHDVVEDAGVTDEDLWRCGFSDRTLLIVHLMTKREGEADDVYYARLRAYEPARRLKLDADVASNTDPDRTARLDEGQRRRLAVKYDKTTKALSVPAGWRDGDGTEPSHVSRPERGRAGLSALDR